jgi:aldehyde dehydrogenase (NAD+)
MTSDEIAGTVATLRSTFESGATKPLAWRLRQLKALRAMLTERGPEFEAAVQSDLGKHPTEAQLLEIGVLIAEIDLTLKNLRRWLRPQRVSVPGGLLPARASIVLEPLGVVLVIAPWNYPLQLLLTPVLGALAAGNAVVAKPSELAPATSAVLARFVPQYLDSRAVAVIEGGVEETTVLLEQRFDHIFYTGNGAVGRIVMTAAAKNLTPVTLELGGKSPVYVDDSTDLRVAARRIAWGKFVNAGQTCVAPDYLLATPEVARRLEPLLRQAVRDFYGAAPETNPDYGHIVNRRQFDRLQPLLGDGRTVFGGQSNPQTLHIAPTVLAGVSRDAPIMQQEIFGPILPLVEVADLDDAIRLINSADRPLALYVFSERERVRRRFLTETSSGAIAFGAPVVHLGAPALPSAGVGASGMGGYHGRHSVVTLSHQRSVLRKPVKPDTMALIYPPYTPARDRLIRSILRKLG